jgi:hypothetical protein
MLRKTLGLSALLGLTITTPAQAMNNWYNHGFADGMVYQQQFCEQNTQARTRFLAEENTRLKKEILALRQQATASTTLATTTQILPREDNFDD